MTAPGGGGLIGPGGGGDTTGSITFGNPGSTAGGLIGPAGGGAADLGNLAGVGSGTGGSTPIFDPTKPPPMKTLIYSPEVKIIIARGNKSYDISRDVVGGSIVRRENAVSSAAFRVSNKDMRYNGLFERMDRVMIYMKRLKMIQVFSGYLDSVPHKQLYGGVVTFRASCTLKRLVHTWWDPGLPASQSLFAQRGINNSESVDGEGFADSGIGALLRDLLIEVGSWTRDTVHIQEFPEQFLKFLTEQILASKDNNSDSVRRFRRMLLSDDISGGVGAAAGRQYDVTYGSYTGTQATYLRDIIAACDERQMGPLAIDSASAAGVIGAAAQPGDPRYVDTQRWEELGKVGEALQVAARDSDAAILGVACAMAESGMRNLANASVPESLTWGTADGVGNDYDSCGLFQQRPSQGWGTVAQEMNPKAAAGMFYNALARVQDWRNIDPAVAIARVQINRDGASTYAPFIEPAKIAVQQFRNAVQATSPTSVIGGAANSIASTVPGLGPVDANSVGDLINNAAGVVNTTGGLAQVNPLATSTPLGSAAAVVTGGSSGPDTAGAIAWAMGQVAAQTRYRLGGETPFVELDCSALCWRAYQSIGMDIGRDTIAQAARGQRIPWSQMIPGDLIQPNSGHVVMYAGNGMIIETGSEAVPAHFIPNYIVPGTEYAVLHFPPATYQGNPAFNDPMTAGPGSPPGTGYSTGGRTEPIARNLFSYIFEQGQFQSQVSTFFRGEKAYINDEPLIQMVQMVARGGLRHFQSAPNGDFVAYYPDWFGLDGGRAIVVLEDIEMKDVKIDMCDDSLATHVYVSGDFTGTGMSQGAMGWLQSYGVATVESEWLFKRMIAAAPGLSSLDSTEILRRFGVRPYREEFTSVKSPEMEFLLAVQTFMRKWADQYRTNVEFTFMPELFPGMRISLAGHNLQVYVSEVTHNWDYEGGFSTSAVIQAPSTPNDGKNTMAGATPKYAADGTQLGWGSEYFF